MFLLVTPAHNEADNVEGLVECVRRSSLRPDLWVVVDDRSTDGTAERFAELGADLPMRIVPSGTTGPYMGFRYSEVVLAGLAAASEELEALEYFGILDCDIRFGPEYWRSLADALDREPQPGIVSGALCSPDPAGEMWLEGGQRVDLPRGGLRLTSGTCFAAVGGMERSRAPDSVMTVRARVRGYKPTLLEDLLAWSVRPTDSRDADESGWESRGRRAYNVGQPGWQVVVRSLGVAAQGRVRSGRGLLKGYLAERGGVRIEDADVLRYYRRERPREWARSIRAAVLGGDSPHRYLKRRPVPVETIEGFPTA